MFPTETLSFFVTDPSLLKYTSLAMAFGFRLQLEEEDEEKRKALLGSVGFRKDIGETGVGEYAIFASSKNICG